MKQIICLSTTPWHAHPTRKQQVMSRLVDCEILYFDPPVSYLAPLKDASLRPRLSEYKQECERVLPHVLRCSLPPVLPFYNEHRALNRWNGRRLGRYVNQMADNNGFVNPLLWVYHPMYVDVLRYVNHSALVYDCVDRHSAYPGHIKPAVVDGMEQELSFSSNVVFATALGLCETLKAYNDDTYLIPNGGNYELFATAAQPLPRPDDMVDITGPILGFVGAIQHCIDLDLIAAAATLRPDWSFAFVGAPLAGVSVEALRALPNVHLLGPKPNVEVPQYIANFDVCLNLFRSGGLAKDVSSLKFFEYLATGKPIVSTPQPLQVLDFSDAVYIAEGADGFVDVCQNALSETGDALTYRRMEYGRNCSWDRRVEDIRATLCKHNILT